MSRQSNDRGRQARTVIAQTAARYIAEHGIADWGLAKRKAARHLGLSERETLPSNDEIEQALREYHTLFQPEEQAATLRAQRELALVWMEQLCEYDPVLSGAVAEGWATEHSEIRIELTVDDPKSIELQLLNRGVAYEPVPARAEHRDLGQLRIETDISPIRLVIQAPSQRRSLPRNRAGERLRADDLRALLETPEPAAE